MDYSYSNEWLLRVTGDARVHGDRLEKAFHNAAPGAINRTFSGHVYHRKCSRSLCVFSRSLKKRLHRIVGNHEYCK